jgi:8-oxo-dGTP pyrophosphatase MutT (NUDIX family)
VSATAHFDPAAVPVRPAATLMLLADLPDLHVLLLRRRAGSAFVGGMNVFPGGGVDRADAVPQAEAACAGLSDAAASARLGVPSGGLAWWIAAIRETFEEAGVLLAVDAATGAPADLASPERAARLAVLRREVDDRRIAIHDAARTFGLRLAAGGLHYAARWITPQGPPRRYDTRFFVAGLPAGQVALHDAREAVDSEWARPADALRGCEQGLRTMLPPTQVMLRVLARFGSAGEVLAAAARHQDAPDQVAQIGGDGVRWRVLLPGDPGWDAGAAGMQGWLRLLPSAGTREGSGS